MQRHFHVLVHLLTEKTNCDVEHPKIASLMPINFSVISMESVDNITVAFFSVDMYKDMKTALHGRLVELMVIILPQIYRHHVIHERVKPVLNVTLKKAFYNCLRLALGFYNRIELYMRGNGFELNPYNPCVTKQMIGGKQIPVCWNVDNLKVFHVDRKEVAIFM